MWEVIRGRTSIGIIETNFAFASAYWSERSRVTGLNFHLVKKG